MAPGSEDYIDLKNGSRSGEWLQSQQLIQRMAPPRQPIKFKKESRELLQAPKTNQSEAKDELYVLECSVTLYKGLLCSQIHQYSFTLLTEQVSLF